MIRVTIEGAHSKHRMAFDVLLRAPRDDGRGHFDVATRDGDTLVSFETHATWAVAIASAALRALEETGDFRIPDAVTPPGCTTASPAEVGLLVRRPVTDPELDAPDGAVIDGYERVGDAWHLKEPRSARISELEAALATAEAERLTLARALCISHDEEHTMPDELVIARRIVAEADAAPPPKGSS